MKNIKILVCSLVLLMLSIFSFGCAKEYTVTFKSDDVIVQSVKVKSNKKVEAYNITKDGYTLSAWMNGDIIFDFNSSVESDLELVAKWDINEYTIKFLNDDDTVIEEMKYPYGASVNPPTEVLKAKTDTLAYKFISWDKEITTVTKDETYKAQFSEYDLIKVTYLDDRSEEYAVRYYEDGESFENIKYEFSDTTNYEYSFISWIDELGQEYDSNDFVNKTLTLSPKYSKKRITLEGAKISFLGDSITTFYKDGSPYNSYYNDTNTYFYPIYSTSIKTVEKTWWMQTINNCKAVLGINNSWSGSTCYNYGSETSSGAMNYHRIKTLGENGDPDIIIVHIGTNDLAGAKELSIFKDSYTTMMNRLDELYPDAVKFLVTFEYSVYSTYTQENRAAYNKFLRELANKKGYYTIEAASLITQATYLQYLEDRLHLNYKGATALANLAYDTLNAYFNNTLEYCNINYNLDGGSIIDESIYARKGQTISALSIPTKDEYDFMGWYLNSDFSGEAITSFTVNEDMTVYAKFIESPKGVQFELNGGNWTTDAIKYFNPLMNFVVSDYNTGTFWTKYGTNMYLYTKSGAQNPLYATRIEMNYDESSGMYKVVSVHKSGDSGVSYSADYILVMSSSYKDYRALDLETKIQAGMYFDFGSKLSDLSTGELNLNTKVFGNDVLTDKLGRNFNCEDDLPIPVKSNYTFDGWYLNSDFSGEKVTKATEGSVVYAKWI